jgi:hypothetical protein
MQAHFGCCLVAFKSSAKVISCVCTLAHAHGQRSRLHRWSLAPEKRQISTFLESLAERASLHALSLAEGVEQETKHAEPASVGPGSSLTRQPNTPLEDVWDCSAPVFVALLQH